jgi:hypothetical protein
VPLFSFSRWSGQVPVNKERTVASLSKVTKQRVKAELELAPGEVLTLWHNPKGYTPSLENEVREADGSESLVLILEACLLEWDLIADTEEDAALFGVERGCVIPLTFDNLCKLPTEFLLDVAGKIKREQKPDPNPATLKTSGSFS